MKVYEYPQKKDTKKTSEEFPVAMRPGDTPVPIPNTMVKTRAADGTMLETAWESRWLPDSKENRAAGLLKIERASQGANLHQQGSAV